MRRNTAPCKGAEFMQLRKGELHEAWSEVLLRYWFHLSAETQEKMGKYYRLRATARKEERYIFSHVVRQIEEELKAEARARGWPG
ncbi:MAG: hypothetical protein AB1671_16680 [Thermodesulfobacteriota bacterium]|jgi:hypothetical protein